MLDLVVATTNMGKVKEFRELLKNSPVNLRSLTDFERFQEPLETGKTFAENAELKARYYAAKTGHLALADDSGLEVEAIGNAPGVFSARYAGKNASDTNNIKKLLKQLESTEKNNRKARFVCEMAISTDSGQIIYRARGICTGQISDKPCGSNGFGYDPVFVPEGFMKTFGELPDKVKQQISHRGKAVREIIGFLKEFSRF